MNGMLILFIALAICGSSTALKCKFSTVDLSPTDAAQQNQQQQRQQANETEYECAKDDKYCVVLGGVLTTRPKNFTFSLRSCESDVKRYMSPISEKIGQQLDYACEHADGKNHTVGPLIYWWNCCSSDDCNSGVLGHYWPNEPVCPCPSSPSTLYCCPWLSSSVKKAGFLFNH